MIKVLFVCLGNICRSPAAEVVFRSLVSRHGLAERIAAASAGTSGMQVGRAPDPRAQKVGMGRGYDLNGLRARRFEGADFGRFDHILAMDRENLADLRRICAPADRDRLDLFLVAGQHPTRRDVPDPYLMEGLPPFEAMFDLIEAGSVGLLRRLQQLHPGALGGEGSAGLTEAVER